MNNDISYCADPGDCPLKDTCRRADSPYDAPFTSFMDFNRSRYLDKCHAYWPIKEERK